MAFSFRHYLSAQHAIKQAQLNVKGGKSWVVDIDIGAFFDEVNHDILLNLLAKKVTDQKVLDLIRKYLKAGIMLDGTR